MNDDHSSMSSTASLGCTALIVWYRVGARVFGCTFCCCETLLLRTARIIRVRPAECRVQYVHVLADVRVLLYSTRGILDIGCHHPVRVASHVPRTSRASWTGARTFWWSSTLLGVVSYGRNRVHRQRHSGFDGMLSRRAMNISFE